jgi:acetoin utilization deacetylase AcuC-like enzyme
MIISPSHAASRNAKRKCAVRSLRTVYGNKTQEIASEHCDGRVLFVLEGGYDPKLLATCVIETILGFEEGQNVDEPDQAAIPARQRAILNDLHAATAHACVRSFKPL